MTYSKVDLDGDPKSCDYDEVLSKNPKGELAEYYRLQDMSWCILQLVTYERIQVALTILL